MTATEHKELIRRACEWLAREGYFAWPNNTGAGEMNGRFVRFGKKGSGDILCVLKGGRHAEFEGKTGEATQSKPQKVHQWRVEAMGGLYIEFHSVEELAARIRDAGY